MDAKALKEITSELTLLYVEDDEILREETAKLFSHLFKKTQTAENGKEALDILEEEDFDLLVSDINMPIMDGVTLCKEVHRTNPDQPIVITSAHDESKYLLELIDIGVDKFILKPLDMPKFLSVLSQVCSNIQNEKLIQKYKHELEESNQRLTQSNEELETLVKILDNKIIQMNANNKIIQKVPQQSPKDAINTISGEPPHPQKTPVENVKDLFTYNEYITTHDLEKLQVLEKDLDSMTVLFNLQDSITEINVSQLANGLLDYQTVLDNYPIFKTISFEIEVLAKAIQENPSTFIQSLGDICILLESFVYVLKKWRRALFYEGVKDPSIYDASMINDIKTIIIILQSDKTLLQNDHEFF